MAATNGAAAPNALIEDPAQLRARLAEVERAALERVLLGAPAAGEAIDLKLNGARLVGGCGEKASNVVDGKPCEEGDEPCQSSIEGGK